METLFVGQKLLHFETLPSTNTYLKDLIKDEKIVEGLTVSTDYQTSGRGQFGNTWEAEEGQLPESCIGEAEYIFSKHRNGKLGRVRLKFESDYARFANIEQYKSYSLPSNSKSNNGKPRAIESKMNTQPQASPDRAEPDFDKGNPENAFSV